jgi:hypothetical protein
VNNKLHRHSMFLLFGSIVLCFPGCSTTAENREISAPPSTQSSDEARPLQNSASRKEILLQFETTPDEAPHPFSDGSLVDEEHAWVAARSTDLTKICSFREQDLRHWTLVPA